MVAYGQSLTFSLLALLMLLWHLTACEPNLRYGSCLEGRTTASGFLEREVQGRRAVRWGFVFFAVRSSRSARRGERCTLTVWNFSQILLDCIHVVLMMDWYHGARFNRGVDHDMVFIPGEIRALCSSSSTRNEREWEGDWVGEARRASGSADLESAVRRRGLSLEKSEARDWRRRAKKEARERKLHRKEGVRREVRLAECPAGTVHPLLGERLGSEGRFWGLNVYDGLIVGILVMHIVLHFTGREMSDGECVAKLRKVSGTSPSIHPPFFSSQTYASLQCLTTKESAGLRPPRNPLTLVCGVVIHHTTTSPLPLQYSPTPESTCRYINTSIAISGAFSIASCALLLALHIFHAVYRVQERLRFGLDKCCSVSRCCSNDLPHSYNAGDKEGLESRAVFGSGSGEGGEGVLETKRNGSASMRSMYTDRATGIRYRDWGVEASPFNRKTGLDLHSHPHPHPQQIQLHPSSSSPPSPSSSSHISAQKEAREVNTRRQSTTPSGTVDGLSERRGSQLVAAPPPSVVGANETGDGKSEERRRSSLGSLLAGGGAGGGAVGKERLERVLLESLLP